MDIKIVICFIIICSIPPASAADALWTAKSSGFIGSDDSLSFENYVVKADYLDEKTSSISVYKNNVLIDTANFAINDIKNYDNIAITLLGIGGEKSWISISKLENKEFWRYLNRTQLKWGESYTIENYTFAIDTYGRDSANLTISNKSWREKKEFFTGDEKYFENFRMSVANINRTGFMDLDFFTKRLPDYNIEVFPYVKVEIITDKEEYFPDEPIKVSVNVASDLTLNVAGITVDSDPVTDIIPASFAMTDLSGARTFQSTITRQPTNSSLSIKAKIEVRDFSGNSRIIDVSKDVSITPEVAVMKLVPADTDDEMVTVQLYVYNSAQSNRSVSIADMVPDEFTAKPLGWNLDIGPKKSMILEYNVTPGKPGMYFLPSATAMWESGTATSKRVKFTMHMPYLSVAKSIEYLEGNTFVTVTISNVGDRPAQVELSDTVPPGEKFLNGETTLSEKLENGKKTDTGYFLQGEVQNLPAAHVSYNDIRGVTRKAISNTIESGKMVEKKQQENSETTKPLNVAPTDLVLFMIVSYITIAGIILSGALIAYSVAQVLR